MAQKKSSAVKKIDFINLSRAAVKNSSAQIDTNFNNEKKLTATVLSTSMVLIDKIPLKEKKSAFRLPNFLNRSTIARNPSFPMNQPTQSPSDSFFSQYQSTATTTKKGTFNTYFQQQVQNSDSKSVKILVLLGVSLCSFLALVIQSGDILNVNLPLILTTIVVFLATTTLGGLLAQSKTLPIWVALTAYILAALVHFLVIGSLNPVSGIVLAVIALIIYQSFRETNKNLVASRIIYINGITKSSLSLLELMVILVIGAGLFSTILHIGSPQFVSQSLFDQPTVRSALVNESGGVLQKALEAGGIVTLPKFESEYAAIETNKGKKPTIRELMIWTDYDSIAKNILADQDIKKNKIITFGKSNDEQLVLQNQTINNKLASVFAERYESTKLTLESPVTTENYTTFMQKKAYNTVSEFEQGQASTPTNVSFLKVIPKSLLIASLFSLLLIGFLFVVRTLIKFITNLIEFFTGLTLRVILWELLKVTGVVKVEVAQVEAEVIVL